MTATQILETARAQDGNISIGDAMTTLYGPLTGFVLKSGHEATKVFDAARVIIVDLRFPADEIERMLDYVQCG